MQDRAGDLPRLLLPFQAVLSLPSRRGFPLPTTATLKTAPSGSASEKPAAVFTD